MRTMIPAFAALVLAASPMAAFAQSSPTPAPQTAPATPAPRVNRLDQRFTAANTTNDGHLTLDQAKAAKWNRVVKNFAQIDTDHKGYITEADIRSAAAAARAAKAAGTPPAPQKS